MAFSANMRRAKSLMLHDHSDRHTPLVFPFETEDDRVAFVDKLLFRSEVFEPFLRAAPTKTTIHGQDGLLLKAGPCDAAGEFLSFPAATRHDKLAFAAWVEHEQFGYYKEVLTKVTFGTHIEFPPPPGPDTRRPFAATTDREAAPNPEAAPDLVQETLRAFSDELYDAREGMNEATYVRLSNALKRRYNETQNSNNAGHEQEFEEGEEVEEDEEDE